MILLVIATIIINCKMIRNGLNGNVDLNSILYPFLVYYFDSFFKLSGLNTQNTVIILFFLALFCQDLLFTFPLYLEFY